MKAIDFYKIDIVAILPKWMKLLDELKIVHPMLLYSVSDTGLPVDCKCATIIQVFEPLTELMKTNLSGYRVVPARPANGKNSWLRRCLETAIRQYGSLIFEKELGNEDKIFNFTDQLKDCRHRIMHISSKQNKKYMSDTQNVLYAAKLFLLYRVIIFNLLGISKELYEQAINVIAKQWDDWYDFVNKGHEFITEFFFYFPLCLHPPPCPLFGIPKTPFLWYHAAKGGFLYAGNLDDGDDWPAGGEYCAAAGFDIPQKCLPGPGPGIGAAADAVHSGGV